MSLRKFADIKLPVQTDLPKKRIQIVETRLVRKTSILYDRRTICDPATAAELGRQLFEDYDKEYLYAVFLSTKCEPIAIELMSIGTLDSAMISPKDILKTSLLCSAFGYILYHNHPSGGDIQPSKEDINITRRLKEASNLIGIKMVDHIILSDMGYISMKEREVL
jgi:DNA repair protein RadC